MTDTGGTIDSDANANVWLSLVGGTALGDYVITVTLSDNPTFVKNSKLDLSPIVNIALILGYSFTLNARRSGSEHSVQYLA